jgi:hypothetical protein
MRYLQALVLADKLRIHYLAHLDESGELPLLLHPPLNKFLDFAHNIEDECL